MKKVSPEVLQGAWAAEPCPWPAVLCSAGAVAAVAAADLPKYKMHKSEGVKTFIVNWTDKYRYCSYIDLLFLSTKFLTAI